MQLSKANEEFLLENRINTPAKEKEFIKDLRLTLRLDFDMTTIELRRLNDNEVIDKYLQIMALPENRIEGAIL